MPRYRRIQTITHEIGPSGSFGLSVTSADVKRTSAAYLAPANRSVVWLLAEDGDGKRRDGRAGSGR